MNETLVTMVGNVASTVSYAQTAAGVPVANFRMATTERRFDRGSGDWVDGDTSWVTVVAWRWLATNLVSSVSKGDPVVVSGRLRVREWEEEERRRSVVEIDARVVGHDLSRGTSAFRRAVPVRPELPTGQVGAVRGGLAELPPAVTSVEQALPGWIVAAVEARRSTGPDRVSDVGDVGDVGGSGRELATDGGDG
ncbi:single-stranded DNA-binding protein [Kitasatospora sp. NPDC094015]|uniref:single-stranded DNA-binding protein n=1 Tax=Kitasatospora sp. NPDC094015 TaxID=3155205 RepID=UPI00331C1846